MEKRRELDSYRPEERVYFYDTSAGMAFEGTVVENNSTEKYIKYTLNPERMIHGSDSVLENLLDVSKNRQYEAMTSWNLTDNERDVPGMHD